MSEAAARIMHEPADTGTRAVLAALGLAHAPFPQTPDAANYFQTAGLERDMAEVTHCLLARKGFVLLTGEVGQGKTTFLRRLLLAVEREGARSCLIFNTFLQGPELLAEVLRNFGLRPGRDLATNLARFNRFLLECWRSGSTCVLFIDDAQNLDAGSLELLRLLTNLESGHEKLLQIVLAGQPELEHMLQRHDLRQLASRIVKHVRLEPLTPDDLARYIAFRLERAGAGERIHIDQRARSALYRDSAGNPRRVHLIMDRCLYGVIASGRPMIDAALVQRAAGEAGITRARPLPRRMLALASAALVVAAGLATAAGLRQEADTGASPVATMLAVPGDAIQAAVAVVPSPPASDFGACIERAATDVSKAALQIFPVDGDLARRIADRDDVCLQGRDGHTLVAWAPVLPLEPLVQGGRGEAVLALQSQLFAAGAFTDGGKADPRDGLFGPDTAAAVRHFQQSQQLPATGRVDPLTLILLENARGRG